MSTIQITCDNCGAKYKLPESFASPKAKCQKCGSVIDVATQRQAMSEAPAAAAAPKPAAAARPAVDRSKQKPEPAKPAPRASTRGSGRRQRGGGDGGEGESEGHGRRGHREKKKDSTPLIVGAISLVALVVVVIVFVMKQDDEATTDTTAQAPTQQQPAAPAAPKPAAQAAPEPEPEPEPDVEAPPPDSKAAEASAPAEELPPDAPRWMRLKIQTMDQVDTDFPEVPWDQLPADKKEDLQNKAADYAAGGRPGLDAEQWMREHPYEAMFGLLDHLRSLDHRNPMDMLQAYALNRFMTEITNGLQTGFVAVELDETMDPRKAHWNCMTTRAWLQFFKEHPDAATFKEKNEERRKAQLKESK